MRIMPDLTDDKIMSLFHKGVKGQWAADELDWSLPFALDEFEKTSFARILTPVYLGEQTAMAGAAKVIPYFMTAHEHSAQLYLTTFMLDEARHFEMLTRVYRLLDRKPLDLRDLREMFQYHYRLLQSNNRVHWLFGILISDLFAKHFYGMFVRKFRPTLFGQLSIRIIRDEGRHQAFAEHYLYEMSDSMPHEMRQELLKMRDDLLRIMESMCKKLVSDTETLGFDGYELLQQLNYDVEKKVRIIGMERDERSETLANEPEEEDVTIEPV